MITIVKVNLLTDDEELPSELRSRLTAVLQEVMRDDPEGQAHAKVTLEWQHAIHNRDYMASVQTRSFAERIPAPRAAAKTTSSRKRR